MGRFTCEHERVAVSTQLDCNIEVLDRCRNGITTGLLRWRRPCYPGTRPSWPSCHERSCFPSSSSSPRATLPDRSPWPATCNATAMSQTLATQNHSTDLPSLPSLPWPWPSWGVPSSWPSSSLSSSWAMPWRGKHRLGELQVRNGRNSRLEAKRSKSQRFKAAGFGS